VEDRVIELEVPHEVALPVDAIVAAERDGVTVPNATFQKDLVKGLDALQPGDLVTRVDFDVELLNARRNLGQGLGFPHVEVRPSTGGFEGPIVHV
jgi:hypothetical protein